MHVFLFLPFLELVWPRRMPARQSMIAAPTRAPLAPPDTATASAMPSRCLLGALPQNLVLIVSVRTGGFDETNQVADVRSDEGCARRSINDGARCLDEGAGAHDSLR